MWYRFRATLPRRLGGYLALAALAGLIGGIAMAPRAVDEQGLPVDALRSLPSGPGVLNQYDWGGWLIWRAPATPVFVDGRLVPYLGAVMDDYRTVLEARPGWRDVVVRRGIRYILVRPRDPVAVRALDLAAVGALTFEPVDLEAFPCLGLAYEAGRAGGGAPATLSAANEVAVEAFLGGRIPWLGIAGVVEDVMQRGTGNVEDVADVLEADRVARERAREAVERRSAA